MISITLSSRECDGRAGSAAGSPLMAVPVL